MRSRTASCTMTRNEMRTTRSAYFLTLVLLYFTGIVSALSLTEPRLWQQGCWKTANLTPTIQKHLDFNSPGGCYDFCHQLNNQTTLFIALQNNNCACLATLNKTSGYGRDCSQRCSGNTYHYCGDGPRRLSSVYKIEENATSDNHLCTKMNCQASTTIMDTNCSETMKLICGRLPIRNTCEHSATGTWTDLNNCSSNSEAEYEKCVDYHICTITVWSWVRAFGKYAPNACALLQNITNGKVVMKGTQMGNKAFYACATGYSLSTNVSRECLANGSWTGVEPICSSRSSTKTVVQSTTPSLGPSSTNPDGIGTSGTNTGGIGTSAIAGIAVAALLVVVVILGTVYCWKRRKLCFKAQRVEDHLQEQGPARTGFIPSESTGNAVGPARTNINGSEDVS